MLTPFNRMFGWGEKKIPEPTQPKQQIDSTVDRLASKISQNILPSSNQDPHHAVFRKHYKVKPLESDDELDYQDAKNEFELEPEDHAVAMLADLILLADRLKGQKLEETDNALEFMLMLNDFMRGSRDLKVCLDYLPSSSVIDSDKFNQELKVLGKIIKKSVRDNGAVLDAFETKEKDSQDPLIRDETVQLLSNYGLYRDALSESADSDVSYDGMDMKSFEEGDKYFEELQLGNSKQYHLAERYEWSPVGIPNSQNACYRISSYQALRVLHPVLNRLLSNVERVPREENADFEKRLSILNAIKELLHLMEENVGDDGVEKARKQARLMKAEENVCKAVFDSGIHFEFEKGQEKQQQDAAIFLDVVLKELLKFQHDELTTLSGDLFGTEVKSSQGPFSESPLIHVPLPEKVLGPAGRKPIPLQDLVDKLYEKTLQENEWNYEGIPIDKHYREVKLQNQPLEILSLHILRGVSGALGVSKNDRPVTLPQDNIIDLSKAYSLEPGSLRYRLKSFIRHHGIGGQCGHYTAYVSNGDKWYHCNDERITESEATETVYERDRAYILLFEKM